jgi:hypothetical protein
VYDNEYGNDNEYNVNDGDDDGGDDNVNDDDNLPPIPPQINMDGMSNYKICRLCKICRNEARLKSLGLGNDGGGGGERISKVCKTYMRVKLGWQKLSNYLVITVVTVFCPQILVTLLTFDTVTGQISESKWKVTSK